MPLTGAQDNCNNGGGPTLATGALDDGNGNGKGGGGPALATDACHDNNGNGDVVLILTGALFFTFSFFVVSESTVS